MDAKALTQWLCRRGGARGLGALLALGWVLGGAPARAQVNAETLRPQPYAAGWSGGLELALALSRGNIDLLDVGAGGRLQHQTLHPLAEGAEGQGEALSFVRQRAFLSAHLRFAERADMAFINQGFAHARWTRMWLPRVGSDVFAQYQFNAFLNLRARAVAGGGVRLELVHSRPLAVALGSGYMASYERIRVAPGAPDAPEALEHRWTNYLTARLALLDEQLLLQNTLYAQPRLGRLRDVRVLEELEAQSRITQALSLALTVSLLYDSEPPTGVRATDLRLFHSLRLTF